MTSLPSRSTQDFGGQGVRRDFRQEVTDNIIQMLEQGVAPWQKPWEPGTGQPDVPTNPTSERQYKGGNAIHLMATAVQRGYDDPRWMTYKQAADQGWQVRRGEKGTQIEFWDLKAQGSSRGAEEDGAHAAPSNSRFVHRVYTVFNAQQIDGVPPLEPKRTSPFEAAAAGERILEASGADISHDQADRAFYNRTRDSIHLPPKENFRDASGYYGTALHELAHWSGHPSRLDRRTLTESYRFGDTNYAKEELRAELASVFLAAQRGIPHNPEQHAAYVDSWITALKRDKNEIFRAAHDASKAADFILALDRDKSIGDEDLAITRDQEEGSGVDRLRAETSELHHVREQVEETEAEVALDSAELDSNEHTPAARESTTFAARLEPGSGTVNVHAKETGTERRATVESFDELAEAKAISVRQLGESARTFPARTDSGNYRGPIIGETDTHIVQQQSTRTAIAHPKDSLDKLPQVGESVRINYADSKGVVKELRERTKAHEFAR